MAPDDVYVPMAARIKLFEKGLGNASNKPAPIVSRLIMCNSSRRANQEILPLSYRHQSTTEAALSTAVLQHPPSTALDNQAHPLLARTVAPPLKAAKLRRMACLVT